MHVSTGKVIPSEIKTAIVTALACFVTPSKVREMVKERFGREISIWTVAYYDPTRGKSELGQDLRELFETTRRECMAKLGRSPISQRVWRMSQYQKLYEDAIDAGDRAGAIEILEQAAKEMGGLFTNRRELTGRDGAPLLPPTDAKVDLTRLTLEELRQFENMTVRATVTVTSAQPESALPAAAMQLPAIGAGKGDANG